MTTTKEIEYWQNFLVTVDVCCGKDVQSKCFVAMLKEIINKHIQRLTKEKNNIIHLTPKQTKFVIHQLETNPTSNNELDKMRTDIIDYFKYKLR